MDQTALDFDKQESISLSVPPAWWAEYLCPFLTPVKIFTFNWMVLGCQTIGKQSGHMIDVSRMRPMTLQMTTASPSLLVTNKDVLNKPSANLKEGLLP